MGDARMGRTRISQADESPVTHSRYCTRRLQSSCTLVSKIALRKVLFIVLRVELSQPFQNVMAEAMATDPFS